MQVRQITTSDIQVHQPLGTILLKTPPANRTLLRETKYSTTLISGITSTPLRSEPFTIPTKCRLQTLVGFNFDQSPTAETSGKLSFVPRQAEDYPYSRYEPYTSRYIIWSGNYYLILPRNFHLSVSPGINYGHTNNNYRYQISATDAIVNDSKENVWQFRGSATLYKIFTDRQNGFFRAYYGSTSNDDELFRHISITTMISSTPMPEPHSVTASPTINGM